MSELIELSDSMKEYLGFDPNKRIYSKDDFFFTLPDTWVRDE